MKSIIKNIEVMKRADQLIRMHATGNPEEFSLKLGVSKTKLYRVLRIMKDLDAPIIYNCLLQRFEYEEAVGFHFGFFRNELNAKHLVFNKVK